MNTNRPTRTEQRTIARDKARQIREQQVKREKRNKWFVGLGIAIPVLAIAAIVTTVIVGNVKPPAPGPLNMASDGVVYTGKDGAIKATNTPGLAVGATPVPTKQNNGTGNLANITLYVDFQCPSCKAFEEAFSSGIKSLVKAGAATLEIHPVAILDRYSSGTNYSSRSANAAACVVNSAPDSFLDFSDLLYKNQPEENASGLTNQQLKDYAKQAGAANVDGCIDSGTFRSWVTDSTNRALNNPLPNSSVEKLKGTPVVIVNGEQYEGGFTATEFQSFLQTAVAKTATNGTQTPAPTPASTPAPTATPAG